MKNLVILSFLAIVISSSSLFGQGISRQINRVVEYAEDIDYEVVRMEADLISSEQVSYRQLYSGYDYVITAVGSEHIADIDLEVYKYVNGSWVFVEEDTEADDIAVVSLRPSSTGRYKFLIKVYRFNSGYSRGQYGLIIANQ